MGGNIRAGIAVVERHHLYGDRTPGGGHGTEKGVLPRNRHHLAERLRHLPGRQRAHCLLDFIDQGFPCQDTRDCGLIEERQFLQALMGHFISLRSRPSPP